MDIPEAEIRKLGKKDIPAIIELWAAADLHIRHGGRDSPGRLVVQMDLPQICFLGAFPVGSDELAGVVLVTDDGRRGWINRLAVHPDARRKGLARRLIRAAEDYLAWRGIDVWCALVEDWNNTSMELFRNSDYVEHDDITYFTRRRTSDS